MWIGEAGWGMVTLVDRSIEHRQSSDPDATSISHDWNQPCVRAPRRSFQRRRWTGSSSGCRRTGSGGSRGWKRRAPTGEEDSARGHSMRLQPEKWIGHCGGNGLTPLQELPSG